MQKHLQKLLLLLAFLVPWVANAQTLTVANGTATNTYVPIYGYYCDEDQHNQMVYPSSMLTDLSGSFITSLTFYQSQAATDAWGTTVTIKLKEITDSTLSDLVSNAGATTVWTGTVNGTTATQVFNLTTPYFYQGGNLLVDITTTSSTYSENYWYGISRSNSSVWVYGYSPLNEIYDGDDGAVESFLPKVTFGYTTGVVCMPPSQFAATVSGDTVSFTWNDTTNTFWQLVWGPMGFNPDTVVTNLATTYYTSYELTDMPNGFYEAYVQTICTDDSSFWIGPLNFNIGTVVMNMATSGSDTLRTCSAIIYDDGGPTGAYSGNISGSILVVYPSDNLHALSISGSSYTESSFDYLRIYEGVGTSGETLFDDYGVTSHQNFGPFLSTLPITIYFHSDGSVYYDGFEINISCVDLPNCILPETFEVSSVQPNSVDFHWFDTIASNWTIAYGPAGFTLGDTSTHYEDFVDTMGSITGLTANTPYDFYLMAVCGADTSWTRMLSVRTACDFINSLPYQNGFESDPYYSSVPYAQAFPYCWTRINDASGTYNYYPYITTTSSYVHSGSKGMYWFLSTSSTYANNAYAVLPGIDTTVYTMSDLTLSFYAKTTSTSYHPAPIVGVMTNPTDASTFTPVYTFSSTAITTTWTMYTISFDEFEGYGNYIAIKCPRPSSTAYMAIDDIYLTDEWCDAPTNVVVNPSTDEVTVSWDYEEGASYTVILGTDTVVNLYDSSYTFVGLNSNTQYNYAVATECATSLSLYVSGSVNTLCGDIDSLPYRQNFESASTGSSSSTSFVNCLQRLNNGTSYFGYPYVGGSSYNHTPSGSKGLYWYNSTTIGTYGDYQMVVLPGVDTNIYPIRSIQLSFWARPSSTSYNPTFEVGVMSNPIDANSFVPVATVHVGTSTTWHEFTVPLGTYSDTGKYVALRATRATASWYAYVDDITLEQMPSCPEITSISVDATAAAARVDWTYDEMLGVTPISYNVSYGYASDSAAFYTTLTTTDPMVVLTGLDPDTAYRVIVSPTCDTSVGYSLSREFSTAALPCLEWDTTSSGGSGSSSAATYPIGNPGTSTTNVMPTNGGYNYAYCNHLIRTSDISMPSGTTYISGIDLQFAGSSPMTNKTNCTIYMCHTTMTTCTAFANPADLVLVYEGPLNCTTTGWNHFEFNRGTFAYNGTSNMIVAIVDNSGSTDANATFYYESIGTAISHRVYRNDSPYTFADLGTVTASNSVWRTNMRLTTGGNGGGECISTASCADPLARVDSVGSTTAFLSWIPGYQETSWDIDYRAESDTTWTSIAIGTTATNYPLTGLTPNTQYVFRVAAVCSDTTIYDQVHFRTNCGDMAVPFVEHFDTWSSTVADPLPACWDKHTNYSSNYPYAATSYNHNPGGSKSMYMYSTSSTWSYMVLPLFAPAIDSLQLRFWLYKTNSSYSHRLFVGVMTDPTDMTTFHAVDTVMPSLVSTWEEFTVLFNNYTGTGRHIAIMSPDGEYSYPYLDDLTVEYIPDCLPVDNLTASNITMTTADLTWVETGTATTWNVEYGLSGFTIGTGTTLTVYDTNTTLTGLTANTMYDVYVTPACPSGAAGSAYLSFRTACGLIDSLPWSDNLESYSTGSSSTGSTFIPCWHHLNNGTSYGGYPYVSNSTSYSHGGGSRGLYWYNTTTTGTYGDYQCVVLPGIDTTVYPINTVQLRFWAKPSSSSYHPVFQVGIISDPTDITTFQGLDTVSLSSTDWTEIEVPFTNFTGIGYYPAIKAVRPTSSWYAYVDDFHLEIAPTCARPSNLHTTGNTSTTVTLDWNERNSATEWELAIETSPTATPTADSLVYSHPTTITGLTGGTNYYFYVRSICGVGDTSLWSDVCVAVPGSWYMRANQTDTLHMCGGAIYDEGGPTAAYFTPSQNSYVIIMPDAPNNLVSVSGTSYTESSFDYIRIYDGIGTSGTELWNDYGATSSQTFGPITSTSGPLTVYFHTDGSIYHDGFAINVSCISAYCRILNMQLNPDVPQSSTQLSVTWDTNGALYYEVEYGASGFTQGTGTQLTTYTNSVVLTGLTALTDYDVYVRSICSSTDTGSWAMGTFRTAMCDNAQIVTIGSESSSSTAYQYPVNNFYRYTLSETIIDSAEIGGPADIQYIGYYYQYSTAMTDKTNCTIYFQPTTKTTFSSSSDIVALDSTAVMVYSGSLNCSQGWNLFTLDTTYHFDGLTNLMVIVDDNSNDYNSSTYTFKTSSCSGNKTIYYYSDSYNPDVTTISSSYSGSKGVATSRVVMQLLSCGVTGCRQPVITGTSHTYESVTANWAGDGSAYEVNIKETTASDFTNADIPVVGTSYTFYGLQPATSYTVRVRQDCTADSLDYSDWVTTIVVTDSLPCLPPDSLTVTDMTNATATFDWVPFGYETMWDVHVWNTAGFDSTYTVSSHPVILGGYTAGVSYNASVRPLCGSAHNIEGDWGDTVTFTAATCPDVTGLSAGSVQPTSLTLSWNNNPAADTWVIEYGYTGFEQGTGTQAVATTPTYVVTGLLEETSYDFYVRAVCGTDWYSENWAYVSATTPYGGVICDAPTGVSAVVAGNAATVNWTAGEGNISYELEYGTHGFAHGTGTTQSATSSPITISNLNYETQYDVYVRAFCEQNASSAWSIVTSFTTEAQGSEDCDPVTNLTATEITENSAVVSWTAGATGSEWEVVLTNASGATLSEARTQEQRYQLNGLTPGTSYIVKVRTVCGDDQYSDYASTSFTTIAVGIDRVIEAACTIYPNPTSSATTISVSGVSGKVKIAVVDMNGRTVASELLECSSDCTKTMDVERLAQGAYFVRITGENVNMVRKLIVR